MTPLPSRRPRGRPPDVNRPQIIADAAIRLLSENGTRSLSHRRVDAEAGLPIGSTVNLAPTRADLLLMAARRLADISMQEVVPLSNLVEMRGEALTAEDVAGEMIKLWRRRLSQEQIYRLRAEMAIHFSQEADDIRAPFRRNVEVVHKFWINILAHLGSKNPQSSGEQFEKWTRGLYYMLGVRGGFSGPIEEEQVHRGIVSLIHSLLANETE